MRIKKTKKSRPCVTRYELDDNNKLVPVDNPVICNPKKPKELNKLMEEIFGNDHMLDYVK